MKYIKDAIKSVIIITGVTTIMLILALLGGEYWARRNAPGGERWPAMARSMP